MGQQTRPMRMLSCKAKAENVLLRKKKDVLLRVKQAQTGGGGMAPPILDFGTRGGWSAPRSGPHTLRKKTLYPLYKELGGPRSWSGWVREIWRPTGV